VLVSDSLFFGVVKAVSVVLGGTVLRYARALTDTYHSAGPPPFGPTDPLVTVQVVRLVGGVMVVLGVAGFILAA
jgi:hypothetical protein